MKDLEQCRREIDEIDQQLIKLFEQRMNVSKDVVTYKLAHGLEIFQPEREKAVIEKNAARMMNPELLIMHVILCKMLWMSGRAIKLLLFL